MAELLTVLAVFLLLALVVVAVLSWPVIEAVREPQRVEQETRMAEWRLGQINWVGTIEESMRNYAAQQMPSKPAPPAVQ